MKRECGMLLPVSSLPSRYGIGAFSKEAYRFIDQLKMAGQQYWQILPLGPTGFGDSPYQAFSAFAGNPYYIDLEKLIEDGLLTRQECDCVDFGNNERDVDYEKLAQNRRPLLKKAYERWRQLAIDTGVEGAQEKVEQYLRDELHKETWNYCVFMAIKDDFEGKGWDQWDEDIRTREPKALAAYEEKLQREIEFYAFQQMVFMHQWKKLKDYANEQGIRIIGDIPIYVAFDGSDSWAHPELFQFDKDCKPVGVAGCPPDAFAVTGQLWGNPLYDWPYHKKTKYAWWMERMEYSFQLYDVVRVDHFRGFDEYYAIPAEDETAEFGKWEKGPGYDLFKTMKDKLGDLDIIAEDLGFLTPSVLELVKKTGFPGMKILEFAFDPSGESSYLPHRYTRNCVVYTGTHDNMTLQGWYQCLDGGAKWFAEQYLGNWRTPKEEIHWDFIRLALQSVARLCVIPVQDYLGYDNWARINEPSTMGKNWRWRMTSGDFNDGLLGRCRDMAKFYGRTGVEIEE